MIDLFEGLRRVLKDHFIDPASVNVTIAFANDIDLASAANVLHEKKVARHPSSHQARYRNPPKLAGELIGIPFRLTVQDIDPNPRSERLRRPAEHTKS